MNWKEDSEKKRYRKEDRKRINKENGEDNWK